MNVVRKTKKREASNKKKRRRPLERHPGGGEDLWYMTAAGGYRGLPGRNQRDRGTIQKDSRALQGPPGRGKALESPEEGTMVIGANQRLMQNPCGLRGRDVDIRIYLLVGAVEWAAAAALGGDQRLVSGTANTSYSPFLGV